jgi:Zn-dependent protease with chaperone function
MMGTLMLLAYAAALGIAGPFLLGRGDWADRAPRLGIVVWQACTFSLLAAVALAGISLAVPGVRAAHGFADLFQICQTVMRAHYSSSGVPAIAGATGAIGIPLWAFGHCVVALTTTARARRAHARALVAVARHRPDLDALVIEHAQPMAYCLPGRCRSVVLSTGTLERLDRDQLSAVIAHERSHLEDRHDLAINVAVAIARAFPGIPLFRRARQEIMRLVEMVADDVAARDHDRVTVAAALVAVAAGRTPSTALGAGGSTALDRVRRLLAPDRPLSRAARSGGALGVVLLVLLPLELAANPALVALLRHHCHLVF